VAATVTLMQQNRDLAGTFYAEIASSTTGRSSAVSQRSSILERRYDAPLRES
jgi:hypothetical protein